MHSSNDRSMGSAAGVRDKFDINVWDVIAAKCGKCRIFVKVVTNQNAEGRFYGPIKSLQNPLDVGTFIVDRDYDIKTGLG